MDFLRTLIEIKIKFFSFFIQQDVSDHCYSNAYLDYLTARHYEFKALHQSWLNEQTHPFSNFNERNAMQCGIFYIPHLKAIVPHNLKLGNVI